MKTDVMIILDTTVEQSKISDVISVVENEQIGFQIESDQNITVDVFNAMSGINAIYGSEALTTDGTKTAYKVSHSWISTSSVAITVNGTPVNNFTAYDTGDIVFDTPPVAGTMVVSMLYVPEDIDTVPLQTLTMDSGRRTITQDVRTIRYLRVAVKNNTAQVATIKIKAIKN